MCQHVILVVLWLLICTRSCLIVVGFLSIAEPLYPSRCLFGTILVTLCLMVWDWWASRAEPMLSCWHHMLFLFVSYILTFSSFNRLVVWGWGLRTELIEYSHSLLALHSGLQFNNNNNNNMMWRSRECAVEHKWEKFRDILKESNNDL